MLVQSANKENDYNDDRVVTPIITTYTAAQIDINTLYAISYKTATDEYLFELNNAQTAWLWTANKALPLDSAYFANMATALQKLTTETKLKVTAAELVNYGLDAPWLSVSVSDNVYGAQTFIFGSATSDGEKYYFASSSNSDYVYTVDAATATPFNVTPYQMVMNDTLPTIDTDRIQRIEFNSSNDVITYTYYDGGKDEHDDTDDYWYVTVNSEDEAPIDPTLSEALASMYSSIEFSTPIGYTTEEQQAFGLDEPTILTVYYSEPKTITDSTTGVSATVIVDKSFSLYLGYLDASNYLYACLPDSVLSYSIDAGALSRLYTPVSKAS